MSKEDIIKGIDKLIDECYSKELSACPLHTIFQRQKFLNKLLPLLDKLGVVIKVDKKLSKRLCNVCAGEFMTGEELIQAGYVAVEPLVEPFLE